MLMLQQASQAFFVDRWILPFHQVSVATKRKYIDKVVTTVACAGHRVLYKNDLVNMDVPYRKNCADKLLDLHPAQIGV